MKRTFIRKDLKRAALHNLRYHYLILFIMCFVVAALGVSFDGSFDILSLPSAATKTKDEEFSDAGAVLDPVASSSYGLSDFLGDLLRGDLEKASMSSEISEANAIDNASAAFGRTNGLLASLVNGFSSGKFLVSIWRALLNVTKSNTLTLVLYALGAVVAYFLYVFVFLGIIPIIMARVFLECRTYKKVPLTRAIFLLQLRKWMHVVWVIFVKSVFELLWSLTIIGGFIKLYSYSMVPYILAENPNIGALDAITLSRQMMDGYKWKAFVLDLTLAGWFILGILTMGLTNVFFFNMYMTAIETELYVWLRENAKAAGNPLAVKYLNDRWLYEKPAYEQLAGPYSHVIEELKKPVTKLELPGIRGFFSKWFGFVLFYDKKEREYEQDIARLHSLAARKDELDSLAYPWQINPNLPPRKVPKDNKRLRFGFTIYYMRNYSLTSLILIFIFFSMFGWAWEVILHFVQTGNWVNRGVLHGPWLPIYGSGGVLMILLLKRLRSSPILHFFGTIVLCGIVEYWTGYACEVLLGRRYWNYDGYFLNLDGRICAEGLLAFGIGGILMVYFLAPLLDDVLRKLPLKIAVPVCIVIFGLFLGDSIYSAKHPNTNTGEEEQPKVESLTSAAAGEPSRGASPEDSSKLVLE